MKDLTLSCLTVQICLLSGVMMIFSVAYFLPNNSGMFFFSLPLSHRYISMSYALMTSIAFATPYFNYPVILLQTWWVYFQGIDNGVVLDNTVYTLQFCIHYLPQKKIDILGSQHSCKTSFYPSNSQNNLFHFY